MLDTKCGKHIINNLISDVDDDDRGPAPKNSSAFDPAEVDKFLRSTMIFQINNVLN